MMNLFPMTLTLVKEDGSYTWTFTADETAEAWEEFKKWEYWAPANNTLTLTLKRNGETVAEWAREE